MNLFLIILGCITGFSFLFCVTKKLVNAKRKKQTITPEEIRRIMSGL